MIDGDDPFGELAQGAAPKEVLPIEQCPPGTLEAFIADLGDSALTFRYFESRPHSVVVNHLVTLIGTERGRPLAYGHLDPDNGVVWLGVAVVAGARGHGWGREIVLRLCEFADALGLKELMLTVDDTNFVAASLYERFGFETVGRDDGVRWMRRERGRGNVHASGTI